VVSHKLVAPQQGDVVWLNHDPQAGHEQAGHRPALVLSPQSYNAATRLMLCCPVTSQVKGYPFEVALVGVKGINGVILADQLHSFDWDARRAKVAGRVAKGVLVEVFAKQAVLLTVV
jgi:mRNA interferase MazF